MGRKRSIVIDTVALLLGVLATAANVQDSIAGQAFIEKVAAEHPTIRKTWVDGGYRQHLVEHDALSVSTCTSSAATPPPGISPSYPAAGRSNAPWAG